MTVLGPLAIGTRLQFNVSFRIPDIYAISDGNAVITDTLPTALSPYINTADGTTITDDKNTVTINNVILGRNQFTISADGQIVTVTIPAAVLATDGYPGTTLVATIDTIINNTTTDLAADLNLSNTASVSINTVHTGSSDSTAAFIITNFTTPPSLETIQPQSVTKADNQTVLLIIFFQASAISSVNEIFNYSVDVFSDNLVYASGAVNAYYGTTKQDADNEYSGFRPTKDPVTNTIRFPNEVTRLGTAEQVDLANLFVKLKLYLITSNITADLNQINGSYSIAIGGAQAVPQQFIVPFQA